MNITSDSREIAGVPVPIEATVNAGEGVGLIAGMNGALTEVKSLRGSEFITLVDDTSQKEVEFHLNPRVIADIETLKIHGCILDGANTLLSTKIQDVSEAGQAAVARIAEESNTNHSLYAAAHGDIWAAIRDARERNHEAGKNMRSLEERVTGAVLDAVLTTGKRYTELHNRISAIPDYKIYLVGLAVWNIILSILWVVK